MATFWAHEIHSTEGDIKGPTVHIHIMFPALKDKKIQGIRRHFFWDVDEHTIKESQILCDITRCIENNQAYLLRTEITKSHINNHICQHCAMKTSRVTPSFHYVINISLSCNNSIPSFIGKLWRVLLLGNQLNKIETLNNAYPTKLVLSRLC